MAPAKFVGSKWVSEILILLMDNKNLRFSEIMSSLGVTDKVLSEKMKELKGHKLVTRMVKEDRSTVYSLTKRGRRFAVKLAELNEMLEN